MPALGCGGQDATATGGDAHAPPRAALVSGAARFGDAPRLFTREDDGSRALDLYLPQPDGQAVVVRAACASSDVLQRALGIPRVELVEFLSDDDYAALLDLVDDLVLPQ